MSNLEIETETDTGISLKIETDIFFPYLYLNYGASPYLHWIWLIWAMGLVEGGGGQ